MQVWGYAARGDTVIEHVALWFPAVRPSAVGVVFTSYSAGNRIFLSRFRQCPQPMGIRYWEFGFIVSFIPHASWHMGVGIWELAYGSGIWAGHRL